MVNQTDVRLGFDATAGFPRRMAAKSGGQASGDVALVVKGFARLRGEFGPMYLARAFDEDGEPLGYRRMEGAELLFNSDQEAAFTKLPDLFRFKEAQHIYGKGAQPTSDFLKKCASLGILRKGGPGYEKAEPAE